MASLLICVFLGPRFIEYIRTREFGQQIREEGPAGHQGKAGTPTMGGLIMALAVAIPYLILGTMAELGPDAERYHREIGALADELGIDVLITVGEPALPIAEAFPGERYPVGSPEEAAALLEELAQPGDRVLVKGSRSAGLERVLAG